MVARAVPSEPRPQAREWPAIAAVVALWAFHAACIYLWLGANQFATGWDRPKHLVSSLIFDQMLRPLDIVSLFRVFSLNIGYYPPLFPLSIVPLYRLFGVSADVAGMVNVIYMLVLLLSVYGIGRRLYDVRTGLLSAFLASMLPLLFCMAHYTYIDYALTSLITLGMYLLLRTEGFRRPGYSLLFGIALGLGMLTKWTPVVFLAGPFLLTLLRSEVMPDAVRGLRQVRLPWRELLIAIAVALGLTWLWYVPNANLAATLLLGPWLPILSVVLIGAATLCILLPGRPSINVLKSLSVATLLTSLWYLPRADMFRDVFSIVVGGRADRPNFLNLSAYVYYPNRLINEGLGWPMSLLLVILIVATLYAWWRRGHGLRIARSDAYVLAWFLLPFAVATLSTHREVRSVLPLLPPLAVGFGRLLIRVPNATLCRITIGGVVALLIVQFAVLNLTALAWLASATEVQVPLLDRVGLFAHGEHIQWANIGEHDAGYWVVPDMLKTLTSQKGSSGREGIRLGLLINSRYVNEYNIDYLVRTQYPDVTIENLTQNRDLLPGYARLFGCDYLLMRDHPDGSEPADVVKTVLGAPPPFFSENFAVLKTYAWPDGETVYLFANQTHRIPDRFGAEWLTPVQHVTETNLGQELRLLGYKLDETRVASNGKLFVTLYWMCLRPTDEDYSMHLKLVNGVWRVWGEQEGRPRWNASLTSKWYKGQVVEDIRELVVWPGTPPGSYKIEVLVKGLREDKPLEPEGGDLILGPVQLPPRQPPKLQELDMDQALEANLANQVRLLGYKFESGLRPGDGLHLTLFWQASSQMNQDYTVFNHLVDETGKVWSQKDNPPADGYYPTSRWAPGEIVRDRYDWVIPSDAPPGEYAIEAGLYETKTGQRLPVLDSDGWPSGDTVTLKHFVVARETK